MPLTQARPGYLYLIQEVDFPATHNGWLTWNGDSSALALETSLTYPGNSYLYQNPHTPDDTILDVGDWVRGASGVFLTVRPLLDGHIDRGRVLRLPLFDQGENSGGGVNYHTTGVGLFRIVGYSDTASGKFKLLEFAG